MEESPIGNPAENRARLDEISGFEVSNSPKHESRHRIAHEGRRGQGDKSTDDYPEKGKKLPPQAVPNGKGHKYADEGDKDQPESDNLAQKGPARFPPVRTVDDNSDNRSDKYRTEENDSSRDKGGENIEKCCIAVHSVIRTEYIKKELTILFYYFFIFHISIYVLRRIHLVRRKQQQL
jgi:hypothetical protein